MCLKDVWYGVVWYGVWMVRLLPKTKKDTSYVFGKCLLVLSSAKI